MLVTRRAQRAAREFLAADVGITGANFLIAETGSSIIVTNEGNGDLTQTLPRVHIVLASIEKVVPTLEDAGADPAPAGALGDRAGMSVYTTSRHGPRRAGDPDGPSNTTWCCSTTAARDARHRVPGDAALHPLRRLHEPLPGLHAVGGHAYGWVYPGPMGAVLTPTR
jgi:L-lactate dehydrogenase complex protein LldF